MDLLIADYVGKYVGQVTTFLKKPRAVDGAKGATCDSVHFFSQLVELPTCASWRTSDVSPCSKSGPMPTPVKCS